MPAKVPDNFAQIFPEHPHRRMHILVSILAFVLVAGSIIVYQLQRAKPVTEVIPTNDEAVNTHFSEEEWDKATAIARNLSSTTPPLSDKEWEKATLEARRLSSTTPPATDAELEKATEEARRLSK